MGLPLYGSRIATIVAEKRKGSMAPPLNGESRIDSDEVELTAAIDRFLQFGSCNELRNFLGWNFQRNAGLRIASRSSFSRADRERAESNQRDFSALL